MPESRDEHADRGYDIPGMLLSAATSEGSLVPDIKFVLLPNAKGPNPMGHFFIDTAQALEEGSIDLMINNSPRPREDLLASEQARRLSSGQAEQAAERNRAKILRNEPAHQPAPPEQLFEDGDQQRGTHRPEQQNRGIVPVRGGQRYVPFVYCFCAMKRAHVWQHQCYRVLRD